MVFSIKKLKKCRPSIIGAYASVTFLDVQPRKLQNLIQNKNNTNYAFKRNMQDKPIKKMLIAPRPSLMLIRVLVMLVRRRGTAELIAAVLAVPRAVTDGAYAHTGACELTHELARRAAHLVPAHLRLLVLSVCAQPEHNA